MIAQISTLWLPEALPIMGETYLRVTADTPQLVWVDLRRGAILMLELPIVDLAWDIWRVIEMRAATQEVVVKSLANPSSFQATVTLEQLNLLRPLTVVTYPKLLATTAPCTGEIWSMQHHATLVRRQGAMWREERLSRVNRTEEHTVLMPLVFRGIRWRQLETLLQALEQTVT